MKNKKFIDQLCFWKKSILDSSGNLLKKTKGKMKYEIKSIYHISFSFLPFLKMLSRVDALLIFRTGGGGIDWDKKSSSYFSIKMSFVRI